ncbi:uncharacterized protein LOC114287492 isoform X1 [Camellia sinensis]|uniref:uncharacterized protein LOC114287492 isoform X1 n=1 Tax=Camellia sinensis TaxID=4442 RepID=UPI0010364BF6|nr:uncharacterized protein LOC114287492 isoform X1 [Camellia sinensis]
MRRMVVMRLKCLWRLRRRMRTIRSSMMPPMIAKTDTSLAIEAIFMKRWEFDSIEQAAKCISSWFSGTHHEQLLLKGYLESAIGHYVPQLAEQILHNNKNAPKDDYINLKGFIRRAFFGMGNSSLSEVCHTPKPPLVVWCRDGQ